MQTGFVQVENGEFRVNNEKIILRGFSIGSWMNIESFMLRIPGTDRKIRQAFAEVYGKDNADQFFDNFLNYFIQEEDFVLLKSLGVNVLRLPFAYWHFENDQEPGKYIEKGFKHLDRVLELCRKYEIYAILDMHSSPGGQNPDSHGGSEAGVSGFWEDALARDRIINLWGYFAEKYKDNTIIAGYDVLNEPSFVSDIPAFNDFYRKVIQKIREIDRNHIIFLEGDDWARDFSIFDSLGGYQQAISFHFYPGQHVYMSTESEERKAQLEQKISYYTKLREKTGMALWVGETGGHFSKDKMIEGIKLVKDCIDIFEKEGISWTLWTYKDADAMGMIYPNENTKWMKLADDFKHQCQIKGRSNPSIAKEVFEMIENKYSYTVNEKLKEMLSFRIYSLLNELYITMLVKPKLQSIPWEEMKEYPKSFLLDNCEGIEEIAELVKTYTRSLT
jgi:aryl-phospho-beta-D-glucosidase BglC (GH1 family)